MSRLVLDTAQPESISTIDWWADNRHLGAYIGSDHTRRVHPQWLDGGRVDVGGRGEEFRMGVHGDSFVGHEAWKGRDAVLLTLPTPA